MPVEGEAADFSLMMQQPVCADGGSESGLCFRAS